MKKLISLLSAVVLLLTCIPMGTVVLAEEPPFNDAVLEWGCPHRWQEATCTTPKTCVLCRYTEDGVLGHTFDSDCDPTCNACDFVRETSGHAYDNDCDDTCNNCDAFRVVPDHVYADETDSTCDVCGYQRKVVATIVTQPANSQTKNGDTATVEIEAIGDGLTYQWYIKNAGSKKYSKSSIKTNTYTVKMSTTSRDRYVYCVVKDQYGNEVKSKTIVLRMAASITKESATATYVKMKAKGTVKVTALGDGLTYTWYVKDTTSDSYVKSSITKSSYSVTMSSKTKGRKLYCIVKDKYGNTVQSKTFLFREAVSITTQPKTVTVKKNATAKVTVKASGDGLKYTWYVKDASKTKYSKSSITKSTYSVKMTSKVKNRKVYCVVKDKYGKTVKTVTVTLKMK